MWKTLAHFRKVPHLNFVFTLKVWKMKSVEVCENFPHFRSVENFDKNK
jgi:hypothetical protein